MKKFIGATMLIIALSLVAMPVMAQSTAGGEQDESSSEGLVGLAGLLGLAGLIGLTNRDDRRGGTHSGGAARTALALGAIAVVSTAVMLGGPSDAVAQSEPAAATTTTDDGEGIDGRWGLLGLLGLPGLFGYQNRKDDHDRTGTRPTR